MLSFNYPVRFLILIHLFVSVNPKPSALQTEKDFFYSVINVFYSTEIEKVDSAETSEYSLEMALTKFIRINCWIQEAMITEEEINPFLSCITEPLPESYVLNLNWFQLQAMNDSQIQLEKTCTAWPERKACLINTVQSIQKCLSFELSVLFDFSLALGDMICTKNTSFLEVYFQFFKEGGMQCIMERSDILEGMMTCMNSFNINHFNRNLYSVTNCVASQLELCPTEAPERLLRILTDNLVKFYKSSGKVILLHSYEEIELELDQLRKQTSDLNADDVDEGYGLHMKNHNYCYLFWIGTIGSIIIIIILLSLEYSVKSSHSMCCKRSIFTGWTRMHTVKV